MAHRVGKNRTNGTSTQLGPFTDGLRIALLAGAGAALMAAVVVALLLRRGGRGTRAQAG